MFDWYAVFEITSVIQLTVAVTLQNIMCHGLDQYNNIGSRPSDHYLRTVCLFRCLFVQFFSAVFDLISIKLGHMLYVWV